MGAYLIDHPPRRDQFRERTYWSKSRPTGLTVLHTAESVMDSVGPDTGAEAVAEFIRTRTTPGSYHDLCDSDSAIPLVPYELGAYQDGTGSNGFALSISFACRTSDWRSMSPAQRRGFLRQGALAFADQQAWLRANDYPTTPLRMVSKAESDRGVAGFIYHGRRDPGRRSDPGVDAPNLFPWDEWINECRAALSGHTEEDDMANSDAIFTNTVDAIREIQAVRQQEIPMVMAQLVPMRATLDALVKLVAADDANPYTLDQLREAIRAETEDAVQKIVRVQVSVVDGDPATGPTT